MNVNLDYEENWDDEETWYRDREPYQPPSNRIVYNNGSTTEQVPRKPRSYETILKIPSNKMGLLIGKGGTNIKNLRRDSGCKINTGNENFYDTEIILSGSTVNRKKAEELINDLIYKKKDEDIAEVHEIATETKELTIDGDEEFPNWAELLERSRKQTAMKWAKFPPVIKNFYIEHPDVTRMTTEQVNKIRNKSCVTVRYLDDKASNVDIPKPVTTFEECYGTFPEILTCIKNAKFEIPSPIQAQSWPILLSGLDMIGISQTGSGKTLAFILPALIHIHGQTQKPAGPSVLVLAPTRELALQIESEVMKYPYKNTKVICIYGGSSRKEQKALVCQDVDIIVATPGRLNDFLESKLLNLDLVTYLVMDEADRMLDLGFEPQIRKILLYIRPNRQTIMTSATWPEAITDLAQIYMKNPVLVRIGSLDLTPVASVTQEIIILDESQKFDACLRFVKNLKPNEKAIIFCGRKATVDMLSCDLILEKVNCDSIHGGREQEDRIRALDDLKTGAIPVLIATDVASRGIDVKDVTHILNYDFPNSIEEYVHRVGRTGRAGKSGVSITYFTREDWQKAKGLRKILVDTNQDVPAEINRMCDAYEKHAARRFSRR